MTFADQLREQGYQRGRQEGVQQGIQEGIRQIANRLLENGIPIEKITEVTGLTISEIKHLRSQDQISITTE